ncbi:MAG: ATPase, T2SS/T4P/T4SS family [Proteobacteria bacterium]|nr:ATPase, T2SS/T4P/T4SS family [Pseudomonadota bacterium]
MARKRIGELLLEAGLITKEQLEIALKEQKRTGELLGSILYSLGFISLKDLYQALSVSHVDAEEKKDFDVVSDIPEDIEHLVKQSRESLSGDRALKHDVQATLPPLIRLVERIINNGIVKGATDVHVGPDMKGVRVRYRIDGQLQHGMHLPMDLLGPIISRIKIMGGMNIAETRVPQDGGTEFIYRDRKLDLRISTYPVLGGENAVLRILDKSQVKIGLENLGFFPDDAQWLAKIVRAPYGMVIVTGPTGSGKTTTLYSCLSIVNSVSKNIFTIEDPIEYQMPLVRQSQVNVKAGLTFATGLRSILRQDPDIILVGEIRDIETAELALRAALTGHLVFTTLHTNDAISSTLRLVDMGIEPFIISSTLNAIVAQRLVRVLCEYCKMPISKDNPIYERLETNKTLYTSNGCTHCNETGYKGRTVIYEILEIDDEIRKLINKKADLNEIREYAFSKGFKEMFSIGLEKVKQGITTYEEVASVTRAGN